MVYLSKVFTKTFGIVNNFGGPRLRVPDFRLICKGYLFGAITKLGVIYIIR